jgi:hypothetical protein
MAEHRHECVQADILASQTAGLIGLWAKNRSAKQAGLRAPDDGQRESQTPPAKRVA